MQTEIAKLVKGLVAKVSEQLPGNQILIAIDVICDHEIRLSDSQRPMENQRANIGNGYHIQLAAWWKEEVKKVGKAITMNEKEFAEFVKRKDPTARLFGGKFPEEFHTHLAKMVKFGGLIRNPGRPATWTMPQAPEDSIHDIAA